jgi:hypothetical protein
VVSAVVHLFVIFFAVDVSESEIMHSFPTRHHWTDTTRPVGKKKMAVSYSIILPTYNERENLPLIIWLIDQHLSEQ